MTFEVRTPLLLPKGRQGDSGTMKFGFLGVDSLVIPAILDFVRPKITEKKAWYGRSGPLCISPLKKKDTGKRIVNFFELRVEIKT